MKCRSLLPAIFLIGMVYFARTNAYAMQEMPSDRIGPPNKGSLQWIGTVQTVGDRGGADESVLTLRVTQEVGPDGEFAAVEKGTLQQVRLTKTTRLLSADSTVRPVRADLDYGAVLTINGRYAPNKPVSAGGGRPIAVAQVIEIDKLASETMGTNLLPAAADPRSWQVSIESGRAEGVIASDPIDRRTLRITIRKSTGTDWHAQLSQDAVLRAGTVYTLRFRARADVPRLLTLDSQWNDDDGVQGGDDSYNAGLYQVVSLDSDWHVFRIAFTAKAVGDGGNVLLSVLAGGQVGTIWMSDVTLTEGNQAVPAAAQPRASDATNILVMPNEPNRWMLKTLPPADATFVGEDHTLQISVTQLNASPDSAGVQLFQMADLKPGRRYILQFLARADARRRLGVQASVDNGDFHRVGLEAGVDLDTHWKSFQLTFTATTAIEGHTMAPSFCVGNAIGTVWLSNVVLTPM